MALWRFRGAGSCQTSTPRAAIACRAVLVAAAFVLVSAQNHAVEEYPKREEGRTWCVSSNGDDANAGTMSSPFRTIQKAANVARAGDTVLIRQGVYRESIRLAHSGTKDKPITLKNYPNEEPVIEVDTSPSRKGIRKGLLLQAAEGYHSPISWIVIEGLEIRNGFDGIKMYNAAHIVIRNNKILDSHSQGILGNGHHVVIDSNIIARNGLTNGNPKSNLQHGIYCTGTYITITNNVFFRNQAYGIQVAGYTRKDEPYYAGDEYCGARFWVIRNNTFAFHKVRGPIVLWKSATNNCLIENNIFYKNAKPDITDYTPEDSEHKIRGNFSGDPLFVDPENFDFRLRPDSPAIGKGALLRTPVEDDDSPNKSLHSDRGEVPGGR